MKKATINAMFDQFDRVVSLWEETVSGAEAATPWFKLHKQAYVNEPILADHLASFFSQTPVFAEYKEQFGKLLRILLDDFGGDVWSIAMEEHFVMCGVHSRELRFDNSLMAAVEPYVVPVLILRVLMLQFQTFLSADIPNFEEFADKYEDMILRA